MSLVCTNIDTANYVIVAVKPADVPTVLEDIVDAAVKAESDVAEQVLVTIAAGVSTAYYENKLPAGSPVIRVMPNAPVVVGGGVSALARGRFATPDHLKAVSAIFDAVGGVLSVPESQLDAVTAHELHRRAFIGSQNRRRWPDGRLVRRHVAAGQ